MEKKILGIILSVLGISGLIAALVFMNVTGSSNHIQLLLSGGILAAILFFAGIWLIPSGAVYDKAVKAGSKLKLGANLKLSSGLITKDPVFDNVIPLKIN